jgi:hypothetical protein
MVVLLRFAAGPAARRFMSASIEPRPDRHAAADFFVRWSKLRKAATWLERESAAAGVFRSFICRDLHLSTTQMQVRALHLNVMVGCSM